MRNIDTPEYGWGYWRSPPKREPVVGKNEAYLAAAGRLAIATGEAERVFSENHLSHADVARALGLSSQTMWYWFGVPYCSRPNPTNSARLALLLDALDPA